MAGDANAERPGLPANDVLSQICTGLFDDPFAVLGPRKFGQATYLTAFDPGAAALFAEQGNRRRKVRFEMLPEIDFRILFAIGKRRIERNIRLDAGVDVGGILGIIQSRIGCREQADVSAG